MENSSKFKKVGKEKEKMKILLVKPIVPKGMVLNMIPPIGLGFLATAVRKAGFSDVLILDCGKENLDVRGFIQKIRQLSPKIVGFQVFSNDLPSLRESLKIVKNIKPSITTVAGGPHPSGLPEKILENFPNLDFAFKGEAEVGFPLLLKKLKNYKLKENELKKIPGLIWRTSSGKIKINPQIFPQNLDNLGLPAWDLLKPQNYPTAPQGVFFKDFPMAPIMATRGCPFNCTFCAGKTITGRTVRRRSVDHVLSEIELLFRHYGIREVHILDDNFTLDKNYVQEFCEKLLKKDFKISWCCPNGVRLDTLTLKILKLMKKSGCHYVSVGIESGSDRILKLMKKGLTVKKIKTQVKLVKKSGLAVNGFFILGYPSQTKKEIKETIDLAKNLGLTRAAFYNFLPLPGTEAYKNLLVSGELKEEAIDWSKIFTADVPYAPRSISRRELKKLARCAYLEFYLRPRVFWNLLKEIKTLEQFKYILRRFFAYLK